MLVDILISLIFAATRVRSECRYGTVLDPATTTTATTTTTNTTTTTTTTTIIIVIIC